MSRFTFCNCPAGFSADPERHAPDCPGRSGAGKPRKTEVASAQSKPPALGGDAVVIGNLHRDCDERIVFESSGEIHIKDGMPVYGADSVAPLQAEIERLKEESFEELYNAAIDERDQLKVQVAKQACVFCNDKGQMMTQVEQLKARCDVLEGLLRESVGMVRGTVGNQDEELAGRIDAALSKPAGSEQV